MRAELIPPFLVATKNVIETMASVKVTPGKPIVKKNKTTWGVVSGVIGMASQTVKGSMIVSFEAKAIVAITNKMLGETFKEINGQVVDCAGELTNMICGGAKQRLAELGYTFNMATPVTIFGENVEIHQLVDGPTILVPFESEVGQFVIEASLLERKDPNS